MKTITIRGKKYNYKYTLRALFIFERITGKAFQLMDTMDTFTFFYAMLLACNEEVLDFEAFLDACDEDNHIGNEMGDYLLAYFQNPLNKGNDEAPVAEGEIKKK